MGQSVLRELRASCFYSRLRQPTSVFHVCAFAPTCRMCGIRKYDEPGTTTTVVFALKKKRVIAKHSTHDKVLRVGQHEIWFLFSFFRGDHRPKKYKTSLFLFSGGSRSLRGSKQTLTVNTFVVARHYLLPIHYRAIDFLILSASSPLWHPSVF